jgi:hypothetical protein
MLESMLMLLSIIFSHAIHSYMHNIDITLIILQNQLISNKLISKSFYHFK